ncbi:MAG: hypothetical protein OXH68_18955 [Gammaproteobacteria bacterium]|nr:hypothetical protein [Gammaproteobacteria bacterium]
MARTRRFKIAVAIAVTLPWVWSPGAKAASPLAEIIKTSGHRLDVDTIRAVYHDAIVGNGGLDRTLKRLRVFAGNPNRTPVQRANIHLVIAHLHWRHGDRAASLSAIETALGYDETADGLLLKARLLDVAGDVQAAIPFYEGALAATDRKQEAEFICIRLTMAEARGPNVDALVELAQGRDQSFKNRSAIALAILGHPDLAREIYGAVTGDDLDRTYREHVRLAQWALASDAHSVAQRQAWLAFEAAGGQVDARYALALLVESHREQGSLTELIAGLDERSSPGTAMLDELRVDLLNETRRFDDAVAFYESVAGNGSGVDLDSRRRLIKLYVAAGRTGDMIREYRRLMSAEPDVVHWYAGLASHYVGLARREDALDVWRLFETANADRPQALVAAGEQMIGMGFLEEAVRMVEGHMAAAGETVEGLLFLFDARYDRGRDDDAFAILKRLEALVPPGDSAVRDLADAYERMNRPEPALEILEALDSTQDGLGYNERMRLAWLYSLADRKQDALAAWRGLWVGVDNPARHSLAEDQLLLLAAELNTLGDIVVELEEKLHAGRADRNEMDLLVRIYTEVGDTLSATEVIEEFARSGDVGPVERLRQLGNVYRLQNDYAGFDRILRQLVRQDRTNELEHVQNLVLNLLAHDLAEESDERYGEIQRWLERLRALDAAGVSGEFEAGILSLGGFDAEAIESYRRALVRNPENSDNLLLMADRMKSAGRRDEAVTMLQYAAEHALDDNAFVVAVDGIINMIGTRSFGERLTPERRETFQWTQRVILERITSHDDKFYLYQLLADIAQETGDTEGVFRALENSLPQAGIRRPAILRELVTLATPSAGFAGFNTGRGDPDRQLIHGRRLIGLRQALPPDVYINLGKVLLEKDDVAGAEKALDRIEDITGVIDVDKTKADLLYDAGHPERALEHYARALSVNRDDLGLLARNAMLHEVRGHRGVANEMYLQALGNLLRSEALSRPGRRATHPSSSVGYRGRPNMGVSRDYTTYFEFLVQGLLGTWPHDTDASLARIGAVEAMFEDALQAVLRTGDLEEKTVGEFPRLDRTARFGRRVADTVGDPQLAARIDSALEGPFPKDEEEPETSSVPDSSLLQRHLERARQSGNFGDAVQLARLVGDEDTLIDLLRDRITDGKYQDGLVNAWLLLDETAFKRLVTPIASTLKDHAKSFLQFLAYSPHLAAAMELTLGRDLVSVADLIELINQPDGEASEALRFFGAPRGVWRYVQAKGTLVDQVSFVVSIARRDQGDQFGPYFAPIVADLLSVQVPGEQRMALTDALTVYLSKQDLSTPYSLVNLMRLLLTDIHPTNAELVYALARHVQDRATTKVDLAAVLKDIYEGTPQRAFDALLGLSKAKLWRSGVRNAHSIHDRFADERERILAAVERGEAIPLETAGLAYEMSFSVFGWTPPEQFKRQADLAPKFAALDPNNSRYRVDRISALLNLGQWSAAEDALQDYYRGNPADRFARAALYFRLVGEGKFEAALEVVSDGGEDLRDQSVVDALFDQMSSSGGGGSPGLFRRFYSGPRPDSPYNRRPPVVVRNIDRLREVASAHAGSAALPTGSPSGDDQTIKGPTNTGPVESLRVLWRGVRAPVDDGNRGYYMPGVGGLLSLPLATDTPRNAWTYDASIRIGSISGLVKSNVGKRDASLLFDVLVEVPGVVQELESYIPSLPSSQRRSEPRLYELLADALDAAGLSEIRLAELSSQLREKEIGNHLFTLWMTLRLRDDDMLSPDELEIFAKRAAEIDDPTGSELLSMARLYAKGGEYSAAGEHYSLVAANLIRRVGTSSGGAVVIQGGTVVLHAYGGGNPSRPGLSEILAETAEALPAEIAMELARKILTVATPPEDDEASTAIFDAFVLKTLGLVVSPEGVLAEAAEVSPTAAVIQWPLETWYVPQLLELARVHASAGNEPEALRLMRRFVEPRERNTGPATDWFDEEQVRRANTTAGLARAFGLALLSGRYGSETPMSGVINGRERIFPAESEHVWPGAAEWTRTAAAAMRDWLDDADVDPVRAREMLFVAAWQLNAAGEIEAARDVVAILGTELDAEPHVDPVELRDFALLALKIGTPLPVELAVEVAAGGTLSARQEAGLVRELGGEDAAGALRAGRAADRGDKLPLMRELHPLALAADEADYAENLAERIELAEAAYRELGSPTIPVTSDR